MKRIGKFTLILLFLIIVFGLMVQRYLRIQKINDYIFHVANEDVEFRLNQSLLNFYTTKYDEPKVIELLHCFKEDNNVSQEWIDNYMPIDLIRIKTDTAYIYVYSILPNFNDDRLKSKVTENSIGFFDRIDGDILILQAERFNQNISKYINGVVTYRNGIAAYDSSLSIQLLESLESRLIPLLEYPKRNELNQFRKYVILLKTERNKMECKFIVNPCSNHKLTNAINDFTNSNLFDEELAYDSMYVSFYLDINRLKCN